MLNDQYKCVIHRCIVYHDEILEPVEFSSSVETDFDGIWDRGSLVAINKSERTRFGTFIH